MSTLTLPIADEQPCFGQRQGYCNNMAIWRMDGDHLSLHFCDECKNRENIAALAVNTQAVWTALPTVSDGTTGD
jgi:hypothetical protein